MRTRTTVMLLAGLAVDIVTLLENGLVLMLLWRWFVEGPFAVGGLSYGESCGLVVLFSLVARQWTKVDDADDLVKKAEYDLLQPVFLLVVGAVVHLIVG